MYTTEASTASEPVCITEAFAAPGGVYSTTQGPKLHLDVSALQRHMLHWQVSIPEVHELLLDMSTKQRSVLLLDVSRVTPQGPEVHLYFLLQRHVLHLDLSTPRGLICTWTWSDNRSLCCSWTCLFVHYRGVTGAASGRI